MAIEITNNTIDLRNGLSIDTLYIRLEVSLNEKGDTIRIRDSKYLTKEYYNSNKKISAPIRTPRSVSYDRDTQGSDILKIAHDKVKESLINDYNIDESNIEIVDVIF
jgi:hypothetical protein